MNILETHWVIGTLLGVLLTLTSVSGVVWLRHEKRPRPEEDRFLPSLVVRGLSFVDATISFFLAIVFGVVAGMGLTLIISTFVWGYTPPEWVGRMLFPSLMLLAVIGAFVVMAKPYPDETNH